MNVYAIGPLLVAVSTLAFGLFTFLSNPKAKLNRLFFGICASVFVWAFGYSQMYRTVNNDALALSWARIGYIGVPFVPVFVYHFIVTFLELRRSLFTIGLTYACGVAFLVIGHTNLFLNGMYHNYFWGYYPKAGPLYIAFVLFFALIFTRIILLLYQVLRHHQAARLPVKAEQVKYMLFGFALATTSLVDYVPNYGIQIYPWGYLSALGWLLAMGWACFRYRLLDINVVITRTAVFAMVYALVLGVPLLGALVWQPRLEAFLGARWWVLLLISYAVLATAAHYANQYFQRRAETRLRAEELEAHRKLGELSSRDMLRFTELQPLLDQIVHQVVKILKIAHAAVSLADPEDGSCKRQSAWGPQVKKSSLPESVPKDSSFIRDLAATRLPRVQEELKLQRQAASPDWRELTSTMDQLKASVVIPAFKPERFFGFLALGDKRSGRIWTQDDLNMLTLLANQAALAIENVQLHEAQSDKMVNEAIDKTLIQIASGVGHQFSNTLNDIKLLGEMIFHSLKGKSVESLSPEERTFWLGRMWKTLERIIKEATLAGGIAKGILSISKKSTPQKLAPVEVPPLIEMVILRVLQKHAAEKIENEAVTPAILNGVPKDLPTIPGNSAQIQQIFYNLIDNAVDGIREKIFQLHKGWLPAPPAPYKGRVQIKAQAAGGRFTITIEDDGIGIKPEDMKELFVPYFTTKGQSKGRGLGGHGLGLFVIKQIVEAHGGKIRVASEPTQWTRFTIDLPVWKKEPHGP